MAIIKNLLTAFQKIFKKKKRPSRRKKKAKRRPAGKRASRKKKTSIRKPKRSKPLRRKAKRKKPVVRKKHPARKTVKKKAVRPKKKIVRSKKKVPKPKKPVKKPVKKTKLGKAVRSALVAPAKAEPQGVLVGEITHYFSKIMVCVVNVSGAALKVGDQIRIKGHTTDFVQTVKSMQIESRDVPAARKGQLIGLKIKKITRAGDLVYKL